jgi:copper chaperone
MIRNYAAHMRGSSKGKVKGKFSRFLEHRHCLAGGLAQYMNNRRIPVMTKFNVPNMSCGHCTAAIEKAVKAADAGAQLNFDLEARSVEIISHLNTEAVAKILEGEGYPNAPAT